jgi:dihydroxyacetone kinase-like protein
MVGDKTMVDVFSPVLQSMKDSREKGKNLAEMLQGMVQEAENGMVQTIGMIARKGRASYLGDRSIGHQDPGATSAYLLIRQAAIQWS